MQRAYAGLILLTAIACQVPSSRPFTNQAKDINFREYYYPAYKLLEPTVYCYADSTGEIKMYMQHQISVEGPDSILTIISYDSAFTFGSRYTETYANDGIYAGTLELAKSGEILIKGKFDTGFTAWRQPLQTDSISFLYRSTHKYNTVTLRFDISGYFTEVSDSGKTASYKPEECVLMHTNYRMEGGADFQALETTSFNANMVFAKGVGMVYIEEPKGGTMTKYYLRKIAPASEFAGISSR